MKKLAKCAFCLAVTILFGIHYGYAQTKFKALALYENGGHHVAFSKRAVVWLDSLAAARNFEVDYFQSTDAFDDQFLAQYGLIIQLDFVPYGWNSKAVSAFEKYINEGRGGWIGLHHATLLGEFDGFKMWPWFSDFMGGIRYKNYIPTFAAATVVVENKSHPVMKGLPGSFEIAEEEWYIYDKSPRPNVNVLARVNEDSYRPNSDIKMGDHPVIWQNPHYNAKNVYIFMGHSPKLFDNKYYNRLLSNAIIWASGGK